MKDSSLEKEIKKGESETLEFKKSTEHTEKNNSVLGVFSG